MAHVDKRVQKDRQLVDYLNDRSCRRERGLLELVDNSVNDLTDELHATCHCENSVKQQKSRHKSNETTSWLPYCGDERTAQITTICDMQVFFCNESKPI